MTPCVFDLELLGASKLSAVAEEIAAEHAMHYKMTAKETEELSELILKRIQQHFLPHKP